MINVQDESEFACQVLNRDIWSNAAVKSIVEEHFVFWQVASRAREGQRYMQFYPVLRFPYIAILDPRTGMTRPSVRSADPRDPQARSSSAGVQSRTPTCSVNW